MFRVLYYFIYNNKNVQLIITFKPRFLPHPFFLSLD